MRARTLLSAVLVAVALAGCGRDAPTVSEIAAPGAARRETAPEPPLPTGTTTTQAAGGYLGSGNRGDSTTVTPPGGGG
jgi:hypothetical protein